MASKTVKTLETIPAVPPEDLAKYVIICEVTEKVGDETKQSLANLFAKSPEDAFIKALTAKSLVNKPNAEVTIVGTYARVKFSVVDDKETTQEK